MARSIYSSSPFSLRIPMHLSYKSSLGHPHRRTATIQFANHQKFTSSYVAHLNQDVFHNSPRVDEHICLRPFAALHTRRQISQLPTTLHRPLHERHRPQALLLRQHIRNPTYSRLLQCPLIDTLPRLLPRWPQPSAREC